jgi:hypothetical protein
VAVNAARGQLRSQQLFAALLSETERANKAQSDEIVAKALEYKFGWKCELERRLKLGVTGLPEPFPHPDDVVVNLRTGEVIIKGPLTKEEKAVWDHMRAGLEDSDREIEWLTKSLADPENHSNRAIIEDNLAYEKRINAIIVKAIGAAQTRVGQSR